MSDRYYVYLLRDPRESDFLRSIFYVGKGTRNRALAHRKDALSKLGIEEDRSDVDDDSSNAKEARIRAIRDAGRKEEIEVLLESSLKPIAESTAFAVESALIEVLRLGQGDGLTNQARGHGLQLLPAAAFSVGDTAGEVELPDGVSAVIVPVNGIWGGSDYAGTLMMAADDEIWENCRRTWSRFGIDRVKTISNRAGTDNPVLLLGLAKDPSGDKKNIIVGVYPLKAVHESSDPEDRKGGHWNNLRGGGTKWVEEYNGWVFDRDEKEHELSKDLLRQVLTVNGLPKGRPQDRAFAGSW